VKINFRKIKGFTRRHRVALIIIVLAVFIAIGLLSYYFFLLGRTDTPIPKMEVKAKAVPKETRIPAPYTGLLIDPTAVKRTPLAVVIENHPDARPQSGYPKADLVFETIAEGGITRTLAVFQSQDASEVGPVRSARPYFIDWLTELNAVFVHVGGNVDALDEIAKNKLPDINQFYYGSFFWRSKDRYAPHNVYTTSEKLYSAMEKAGLAKTTDLTSLNFKKDIDEKERPPLQNVSINFSTPQFVAGYSYDQKTNEYYRTVGGVAQTDKATGEKIKTKNIVVQYEPMNNYMTRIGEQGVKIGTIGSGQAIVFQDGKAIVGTWEKASRAGRTKLVAQTGQEILLNPGQSWFEIVPLSATVTY